MNLHISLLSVSTLAAAVMAATAAMAQPLSPPMMGGPVAPPSSQESTSLLARLAAFDQARETTRTLTAPRYSFRLAAHHPGAEGQKISRVQHTYEGLRVFGSEAVVVTDSTGAIVSASVTDRRPGAQSLAAGDAAAAPAPADLKPKLSPQQAITVAIRSVRDGMPKIEHRWQPVAELLLYPVVTSTRTAAAANKPEAQLNALDVQEVVQRYALAYYVKTRMVRDRQPVYHDTIVDARTGAIIAQWQALQTAGDGGGGTGAGTGTGTGNSQYNGVVALSTSPNGSQFRMLDATRGKGGRFGGMAITNADHSSMYNPDPGDVYVNATNTWGDGKQYNGGSTTDANGQTAAVNAFWGLMNTYDTNRNVLGWQSLDGNNTATHIAVHVDRDYDNAFYDDRCKCMFIGDGGSYFYNLGSIDVIGHEMSHGVTAATADLVYSGESGGLNESHSDIGGEMVEAYARAGGTGAVIPAKGNDWMVGQEISRDKKPLRYMVKPSLDGRSADAWSTSLKQLDVHYSSGPNNRMFYFLAQGSNADPASDAHSKYLVKSPQAMTGIGNDKAYRIWFRALSTKFTSSTNYAVARAKVLEAAQELYGADSKEAVAVQRAYAAINVGEDIDEAK
ncbi:M4 family metallopeptidase [Duganella sp. FT27W]|uniref:M4 family metallopeptidase n=1 Tax=Duganella sp. FT27W TaxID=2654636 RepID=UPI00128B1359|nr:M4 family metallopeptidase [Duganella sp. FT27W]MPQ59337.1 M4 family peptidase [Duganella sp. FT27W]